MSIYTFSNKKTGRSRSINWENKTGEKGKGGIASSNLGPSRKGSPCIKELNPNETYTLANIDGAGIIQHIWITVTDRTEKDYYVLRDLIMRKRLLLNVLSEISFAVVLQEAL